MKVNSVYILCKLLLQQHKLCRFQVVVKLYLSGSFWRVYVYICSPTYKGVMLIQEFIFMTRSHPPWSNLTNSQKYARQKCLNLCISVSHLISVQCDIPENIHFYTCICYISTIDIASLIGLWVWFTSVSFDVHCIMHVQLH